MLVPALALMLSLGAQAPAPPATDAASASLQSDVERLYAEGAALYKAGKYRPAIEKFEQAFALFPEPNLLYNMGRAYEALGELDQAILKYRLCATHPQSSPDVSAKAQQKLTVLEAARSTGATTSVSAAPIPAATTATAPPAAAPAASASAAPAAPAASGGSVLPVIGGVTAGVGVLAAAAGGVFFGLGAATHGELEAAKDGAQGGVATLTRSAALDLASEGTDQKTIGVALLGTGAGVIVLGGVLLAVGVMSE